MKRFFLAAFFVFSAFTLNSCVTRGKDFSSDTAWIVKDQTSKQMFENKLGEPFSVGKSNTGATWTYGYYKHSLFGKSQTKELKVYWNDNSTVSSYSFTSSFPADKKLELGQ